LAATKVMNATMPPGRSKRKRHHPDAHGIAALITLD
jgi:hypothetical protein